jgi:hypothetical protein
MKKEGGQYRSTDESDFNLKSSQHVRGKYSDSCQLPPAFPSNSIDSGDFGGYYNSYSCRYSSGFTPDSFLIHKVAPSKGTKVHFYSKLPVSGTTFLSLFSL